MKNILLKTKKQVIKYSLLSTAMSITQTFAATDDAELSALMSLLAEETDLVTKNKMNADYVPGTVTVLHGQELKNLSIKTTGEALGLVPGFYVTPGNTGENVVITRGVGSSLNSSHVKVLLNGTAINSSVYGSADAILRMPIEQVDRVEVIRGPGSSIYGEFAFSGVVNIITTNKKAINVKVGANNYQQLDLSYASDSEKGQFNLQFNGSTWKTDGTERKSGIDNFSAKDTGYSSETSTIFDDEQGSFIAANINYQGYNLDAQYVKTERGNFFGQLGKNEFNYEPTEEQLFNITLSKEWQVSDSLTSSLALTYQFFDITKGKTLVLPAGSLPPGPSNGMPIPFDLFDRTGSEESYNKASWQVNWQAHENHKLLMMLETVHFDVDNAYAHIITGDPEIIQNDRSPTEMNNSERVYNSLVLQEQWQILPSLELTLGLRYDDYSDVGSNTAPRISGVWRVTDTHIIKAQYAEAFRPPTLEQRYFMPGAELSPESMMLKPENLATTEMSYTYRQADRKFISTVFYADYTNLIERVVNPGELPQYENIGEVTSQGVELEWIEYFDDKWQLSGNISYTDTEDVRDVDLKLTGTVNWLANLAIHWNITTDLSNHLLFKYVGEQEGAELPNLLIPHVDSFSAFSTIDYSLAYQNALGKRGLLISFDIKNLTDEYWQSQSYQTQWPEGLNQGGRSYHLAMEYQF